MIPDPQGMFLTRVASIAKNIHLEIETFAACMTSPSFKGLGIKGRGRDMQEECCKHAPLMAVHSPVSDNIVQALQAFLP